MTEKAAESVGKCRKSNHGGTNGTVNITGREGVCANPTDTIGVANIVAKGHG